MPASQKLQRYCELFNWFRWCFPSDPLSEAKFAEALRVEGVRDYALTSSQVVDCYLGQFREN